MSKYKNLVNSLKLVEPMHAISSEESVRLKKVLLDAVVEISSVCDRNGITAFLCGGTLLGAIRHKGFIPWDDDVDLTMTRSDFEKFKLIFEKELGEKYILNAPNYCENPITRFPKVLLKNTKLETIDINNDDRAMIDVDIFILENVPENKIYRKIKGCFCNFYMGISSYIYTFTHKNEITDRFYMQNEEISKVYKRRLRIGKFFLKFKNEKWWFDKVDSICQYNRETSLLGIPTGRHHYFGEILPKETYSSRKSVLFEDKLLFAPGKYENYLVNLYGDYMKIPPIEKRETHFICNIDFEIKKDL